MAAIAVKIIEKSALAWIATKVLKQTQVAIVFGSTIHLWKTSREEFLCNRPWVLHELAHVRQFLHYGKLNFMWLYLTESLRNGYYNNRFEVEASNFTALNININDFRFD